MFDWYGGDSRNDDFFYTIYEVIKPMTEQIPNIGKDLNDTFLPNSILRKSQNKLNTSLTQKCNSQHYADEF